MIKDKRDIERQIALNSLKKEREVVEVIVGKYKGRYGEIYDANECNVLVRLLIDNEEIELDAEHVSVCNSVQYNSNTEEVISHLLTFLNNQIEDFESTFQHFNADIEKRDFLVNTVVYREDGCFNFYTIEEQTLYVSGALSIIEELYSSQQVYIKPKEKEQIKAQLTDFLTRIRNVKIKIQETHKEYSTLTNKQSFLEIAKRISETKTIETEDIRGIKELSLKNFMKGLSEIPTESKKAAYSSLICIYINDCKIPKFSSKHYASTIAELLHNLVCYSYADFEGFDENLFWSAVFKSTTKHYILEKFLRKLEIEYQHQES